jgi:hypothetical protein
VAQSNHRLCENSNVDFRFDFLNPIASFKRFRASKFFRYGNTFGGALLCAFRFGYDSLPAEKFLLLKEEIL